MILCFSHLLSFLVCTSLFLFALKMVIMRCYSYYYSQFMAMMKTKKYFLKRSVLSNAMDSSRCGLGLITDETARVTNPNVAESSSPAMPSRKNEDPGGMGFIDEMGGGVDGLMSCTESLGFESCDERRVEDDDDDHDDNDRMMMRRKRSEAKRAERNKKFPPPLSSLNQNGQPSFYLKPVRKNGRLQLTEVRIQRPEILRAVRENGRLRLHLVSSDVIEEERENEESKQEEESEQDLHLPAEEEEELWKYRINGEDYRRCHAHEMVMSRHHHMNKHHSLHVWRQPCVTR